VLHATDREFDPVQQLPAHHHRVGPLFPTTSGQDEDRFDLAGDSWALVSTSTDMQGETDIVEHAIDALQHFDLPVLATAPGRAHELRPKHHDVRIEDYVPHDLVLGHSRLFVTDAGHGSVMRGLIHGVPMLLVPWGRDQPGVAYRASELGVGIVVDRHDLTASTMQTAIEQLLSDTSIIDAAHRISERLRHEDPIGATCRILSDTI